MSPKPEQGDTWPAASCSYSSGHFQRLTSGRRTSCSARAAQAQSATTAAQTQQGQRKVDVTFFGCNSWQARFPQIDKTVLVDPWLVGELTFAGLNWAFEGKKGLQKPLDVNAIAKQADLLLLSQGLPDHAHKPTLELLPKDLPVVGSPAAARVVADMGFKNVFELDHGQSMTFFDDSLQIHATVGALVGPPWSKRENGFVLRETKGGSKGGVSLYYEPHCDYDEASLRDAGAQGVDVVITPASSQLVAGYELVQGNSNILKLLQQLQPSVIIPLLNASFPMTGPFSSLVYEDGKADQLTQRLQQANLSKTKAT
ncbi:hypothetical protein WJX73_009032 [Symbiochloris irregularis]|uniref:Uncharacterized protein n=1 Tax=Symbiochloris irregularis TaxID=706552 RepID=A0AAW1NSX5_9CHLO